MDPLLSWSKLPFCCGNPPLLLPLPLCAEPEPSRSFFPSLPNLLQEVAPPTPKPGGWTGLWITNSISSSLPEAQVFDGCSNVLEACFCAQLLGGSTRGVSWEAVTSFCPVFRVVEVGGCFCDGRLVLVASLDEVSDEEDEGGCCFVCFCLREGAGAGEGVLGAGFLGASSSSLLLLLESEEGACWATGDFFFCPGWSTLIGVFLVDAADLSFFSVFFFFVSLHFACNFFFFSTDVCFTSCFSSLFFFFKSTLNSFSSVWCSSVGLCLFLGLLFVFSGHLTLSPLNRSRYSTLTLKVSKENENYYFKI